MATKKEYTWGVLSAPTNNSVDIEAELGQSVYVELKNAQYLTGCPVEVSANGDTKGIVMAPSQKKTFHFTCFGEEPIYWDILISANADNASVGYRIFSDYIG